MAALSNPAPRPVTPFDPFFITVETTRNITGLDSLAGVYALQLNGNKAQFQIDGSQIGNVLEVLSAFDIQALTSTPPTLEELFMRHYGNGGTAAASAGGVLK